MSVSAQAASWTASKPLPEARVDPAAAYVGGKLYVFAGSDASNYCRDTTYQFNPKTKTWTTRAPMPGIRCGGPQAGVVNGTVYIVGGNYSSGLISQIRLLTAPAIAAGNHIQKLDRRLVPGRSPAATRNRLGVGAGRHRHLAQRERYTSARVRARG